MVPRVVYPGQKFEAVFELSVDKPVTIESFDVTLEGRTRVLFGNQLAEAGVPLLLGARLAGSGELARGQRRFPCRFALPGDAPPSFRGRIVHVSYTLTAKVDIPWWFDVDREFQLTVAHPPLQTERSPKPALYSSAPDGPREREPHAEISLADSVVQPGDVLRGAVALGNVEFARYTGVRVCLTGWEYAYGVEAQGEFGGWQVELPVSQPREGEPIPFDLRVPDVPPSLDTGTFRIWWLLDVSVTRRLGEDLVVSIPITVLPPSARDHGARVEQLTRAPPTVGNARVQRVWNDVAVSAGMRIEGERLEARVGEVDVAIHRDHPRGRAMLVAELRFPSLGLGLAGEPAAGLHRLWRADGIAIGRSHRVTGRDIAQVRALVEGLVPELGSDDVRRIDDGQLMLERRGAGLSFDPVAALAARALALAALLPRLARALPPPSGVAIEPWRELALALGAPLHPALPSIATELAGHRVQIRQRWAPGASPVGIDFCVTTNGAVLERHRGRSAGDLPGEARSLATELATGDSELDIAADRLSLVVPGELGRAALMLERAEALVKLAEILTRRGAYR